MRGRTARPAEEANVDLTPMLDVVFILLIFFIVTSTFIQERALGAEPPPPPSPTNPDKQDPAILIYVGDNNQIFVNRKPTDIHGVRPTMERLRAENPESALIIQAHPAARTGLVIQIRDLGYSAKMERVNIIRTDG